MCEASDTLEGSPAYSKGDIVWVKLSSYWWPAEVITEDDLPADLLSDFKKPPLVIVKFFDEDSYEYVKVWSSIHPYNSDKKSEFIKKGMAGFRSKLSHMAKFPKDIGTAEERTDGNPNILSQPEFLPVKKINYDEIFGTASPKKPAKGKISLPSAKKTPGKDNNQPHITHRRFLGNDDYRAYICIQYPGKDRKWDSDDEEIKKLNEEPEKVLSCHSCSFKTKRLEVMILHTKMHIQGIYVTSKRKPKKVKGPDVGTDSESDAAASKSPKPKQRKKKEVKLKTADDVFTNLLDEWDDTDEEMEEPITPKKAKKKSIPVAEKKSPDSEKKETQNDRTDDLGNKSIPIEASNGATITHTEPVKPESSIKNTYEDIKNCFDFDEEEEDDDILLPASTGRKIPRVIPEKPKPSISELLEQSQKEDELEEEKVSWESVGETEKAVESSKSAENGEAASKKEILRLSQSVNKAPDIDENIENTFKELMAETELPPLDDLAQNLKPEQNFHDARTVKFPDKGGTALKGDSTSTGTSKKRFVTSFEDFEAGFRKLEDEEMTKQLVGDKEVKTTRTSSASRILLDETDLTNETTESKEDSGELKEVPCEAITASETSTISAGVHEKGTSKKSPRGKHSASKNETSSNESAAPEIDIISTTSIVEKKVRHTDTSDSSVDRRKTRQSDKTTSTNSAVHQQVDARENQDVISDKATLDSKRKSSRRRTKQFVIEEDSEEIIEITCDSVMDSSEQIMGQLDEKTREKLAAIDLEIQTLKSDLGLTQSTPETGEESVTDEIVNVDKDSDAGHLPKETIKLTEKTDVPELDQALGKSQRTTRLSLSAETLQKVDEKITKMDEHTVPVGETPSKAKRKIPQKTPSVAEQSDIIKDLAVNSFIEICNESEEAPIKGRRGRSRGPQRNVEISEKEILTSILDSDKRESKAIDSSLESPDGLMNVQKPGFVTKTEESILKEKVEVEKDTLLSPFTEVSSDQNIELRHTQETTKTVVDLPLQESNDELKTISELVQEPIEPELTPRSKKGRPKKHTKEVPLDKITPVDFSTDSIVASVDLSSQKPVLLTESQTTVRDLTPCSSVSEILEPPTPKSRRGRSQKYVKEEISIVESIKTVPELKQVLADTTETDLVGQPEHHVVEIHEEPVPRTRSSRSRKLSEEQELTVVKEYVHEHLESETKPAEQSSAEPKPALPDITETHLIDQPAHPVVEVHEDPSSRTRSSRTRKSTKEQEQLTVVEKDILDNLESEPKPAEPKQALPDTKEPHLMDQLPHHAAEVHEDPSPRSRSSRTRKSCKEQEQLTVDEEHILKNLESGPSSAKKLLTEPGQAVTDTHPIDQSTHHVVKVQEEPISKTRSGRARKFSMEQEQHATVVEEVITNLESEPNIAVQVTAEPEQAVADTTTDLIERHVIQVQKEPMSNTRRGRTRKQEQHTTVVEEHKPENLESESKSAEQSLAGPEQAVTDTSTHLVDQPAHSVKAQEKEEPIPKTRRGRTQKLSMEQEQHTSVVKEHVPENLESEPKSAEQSLTAPEQAVTDTLMHLVDQPAHNVVKAQEKEEPIPKIRRGRTRKLSMEQEQHTSVVKEHVPENLESEPKSAEQSLTVPEQAVTDTSTHLVDQCAHHVDKVQEEPIPKTRSGRTRKFSMEPEQHPTVVEEHVPENLESEPKSGEQSLAVPEQAVTDTLSYLVDQPAHHVVKVQEEPISKTRSGRTRKFSMEQEQHATVVEHVPESLESEPKFAEQSLTEPKQAVTDTSTHLVDQPAHHVVKVHEKPIPKTRRDRTPKFSTEQEQKATVVEEQVLTNLESEPIPAEQSLAEPEEAVTDTTTLCIEQPAHHDVKLQEEPIPKTRRGRTPKFSTEQEQHATVVEEQVLTNLESEPIPAEQSLAETEEAVTDTTTHFIEQSAHHVKLQEEPISKTRSGRTRKFSIEQEQHATLVEEQALTNLDTAPNSVKQSLDEPEQAMTDITTHHIDQTPHHVVKVQEEPISKPRRGRPRKFSSEPEQLNMTVVEENVPESLETEPKSAEQSLAEPEQAVTDTSTHLVDQPAHHVKVQEEPISKTRRGRPRKFSIEQEEHTTVIEERVLTNLESEPKPIEQSLAAIPSSDISSGSVPEILEELTPKPRSSRIRKDAKDREQDKSTIQETEHEGNVVQSVIEQDTAKLTDLEVEQPSENKNLLTASTKEETIPDKNLTLEAEPHKVILADVAVFEGECQNAESIISKPDMKISVTKRKKSRSQTHTKEQVSNDSVKDMPKAALKDAVQEATEEPALVVETVAEVNKTENVESSDSDYLDKINEHPKTKSKSSKKKKNNKNERSPKRTTRTKQARKKKEFVGAVALSAFAMPEEQYSKTRRGRSRKLTKEEEDFARAIEESLKDIAQQQNRVEATVDQPNSETELKLSESNKSIVDPVLTDSFVQEPQSSSRKSKKGKSRKHSKSKEYVWPASNEKTDKERRNTISESDLSDINPEIPDAKRRKSRKSRDQVSTLEENVSKDLAVTTHDIDNPPDVQEIETIAVKSDFDEKVELTPSARRGRPRKQSKEQQQSLTGLFEAPKSIELTSTKQIVEPMDGIKVSEISSHLHLNQSALLEPGISSSVVEMPEQSTPKSKRGRTRKHTQEDIEATTHMKETSKIPTEKQAEELSAALEFTKTVLELVEQQQTVSKADVTTEAAVQNESDALTEETSYASQCEIGEESISKTRRGRPRKHMETEKAFEENIHKYTTWTVKQTTDELEASKTESVGSESISSVDVSHERTSKRRKSNSLKSRTDQVATDTGNSTDVVFSTKQGAEVVDNDVAMPEAAEPSTTALKSDVPLLEMPTAKTDESTPTEDTSSTVIESSGNNFAQLSHGQETTGDLSITKVMEQSSGNTVISDFTKITEEPPVKAKRGRARKQIFDENTERVPRKSKPLTTEFASAASQAESIQLDAHFSDPKVEETNKSSAQKFMKDSMGSIIRKAIDQSVGTLDTIPKSGLSEWVGELLKISSSKEEGRLVTNNIEVIDNKSHNVLESTQVDVSVAESLVKKSEVETLDPCDSKLMDKTKVKQSESAIGLELSFETKSLPTVIATESTISMAEEPVTKYKRRGSRGSLREDDGIQEIATDESLAALKIDTHIQTNNLGCIQADIGTSTWSDHKTIETLDNKGSEYDLAVETVLAKKNEKSSTKYKRARSRKSGSGEPPFIQEASSHPQKTLDTILDEKKHVGWLENLQSATETSSLNTIDQVSVSETTKAIEETPEVHSLGEKLNLSTSQELIMEQHKELDTGKSNEEIITSAQSDQMDAESSKLNENAQTTLKTVVDSSVISEKLEEISPTCLEAQSDSQATFVQLSETVPDIDKSATLESHESPENLTAPVSDEHSGQTEKKVFAKIRYKKGSNDKDISAQENLVTRLLKECNTVESLEHLDEAVGQEAPKSLEEIIPRSKRGKAKRYSKQERTIFGESSTLETNQDKTGPFSKATDIKTPQSEEKSRQVPPKKNRWPRRESYTKNDDTESNNFLVEQIVPTVPEADVCEEIVIEEQVIEEQVVEINDDMKDTGTIISESEGIADQSEDKCQFKNTEFLKTNQPENVSRILENSVADLTDSEFILPPKKSKRVNEVKFNFLNDSFASTTLEKKADSDILSFPNCDDSIMSTSLRNNIEGLIKDIDSFDNCNMSDNNLHITCKDHAEKVDVTKSDVSYSLTDTSECIKEPADISKCVPPKKKKIEYDVASSSIITLPSNDTFRSEEKIADTIPQPPKKKIQKLFESSQALEKLGKQNDLPQMSPLAKKKSFLFHQEEFVKSQQVTELPHQIDVAATKEAEKSIDTDKVLVETDSTPLKPEELSLSTSDIKEGEVSKSSIVPKKRKKRKSSCYEDHSQKKERRTSSDVDLSDGQGQGKNVNNFSTVLDVPQSQNEKQVVDTTTAILGNISVPGSPIDNNVNVADDHKNEMEVNLKEDDFKFCIQTNLSNLATTAAAELSAIATATLSEIKNEVIVESPDKTDSVILKENEQAQQVSTRVKEDHVEPTVKKDEIVTPLDPVIPGTVPNEAEFVPISLHPTVMSEKDLADAQVEITTDKVISEKKPTSLGMFSMDYLETSHIGKTISIKIKKADGVTGSKKVNNTSGTEFTPIAMTKEFDNRALIAQPKAYALKSELLDILEGNSNSSTNSSGSEQKFKTSFDNYDKQTVVQGMFDFEEAIPSQIVLSNKVDPETVLMDSPKLLERLSMSSDATKAKTKKVVIQSDIKVPESISKGLISKMTKPLGTPRPGQRILIKTTKAQAISALPKAAGNKPIILSEQIIRPANAIKVTKPAIQPQGIKRQYEDIEDVETAFIIPKMAKASVEEEVVPASPEKPPRARNLKIAGKAKILQQTIITPKGEIVQSQAPTSSKSTPPLVQSAQTQPDDTVFDINSMPIVLSDDILTPECIQNMPVVLSEDVIPHSTPISVKVEEKVVPTLAKKIVPHVTPKQQIVFKSTPTGATAPLQAKQMTKARILSNTPVSTLKAPKPCTTALLATGTSADGKQTKYVLVPSTVAPGVPQAKTVKPAVVKKQPVIQSKLATIQTSEPPSPIVGNKIMIVTNQHGQQTRVVLTPQQQKAFMQAQPGSKTKAIIKGAIPKALLESAAAGPSGVIQKVSLPSVPQVATTTVSSQGGLLMTVGKGVKAPPVHTKKPAPRTPAKPQKTILIKNQMGQTVRKIQGTDDADLDRQVAEQLEAIKASARLQQANKVPEIINYTNRAIASSTSTGTKTAVRRSYAKKVDPVKVKPTTVSVPHAQTQKPSENYIPALAPLSPQPMISQVPISQVSPNLPKPPSSVKVDPPPSSALNKALDAISQPQVAVSTKHDSKSTVAPPGGAEGKSTDRPLTQLVIQDGLGNQTTITEGQILAIPSETVDGQPQSYMLVTLDELGNITPLNNEALMSLDPSLGLGGDLNNMVLQVDQGQGTVAALRPAEPNVPEQAKVAERLQLEPPKIAQTVPEPKHAPVEQPKPQEVPLAVEQQIVIGEGVLPGADAGGQQLIVTGDPIATQKFLESLSDGSTDLANILANAEGGSVLIQADGQQILIKTNTGGQSMLGISENTEGGGNPIFGAHKPNQDILAAALANTDVFQPSDQSAIHSSPIKGMQSSQLSPSGGSGVLYPMHVSNVLETSLTLNSPIMTPLEVPSMPIKKISDDVDILNQVPKNVDLPITITDPNISQTVAQQQAIGLMELTLPISETTVSSEMNSPSYSYSLPALDEPVGHSQKPFNGSMPLLTEDVTEMENGGHQLGKIRVAKGLQSSESSFSSTFGTLPLLPETIESSSEEVVKTSCFGEMGSLPMLTEDVMEDSGSSMGSSKPPRSSPKSVERDIVDEGLSTLGGEMCSSLSEPPPDMFDLASITAKEEEISSDMSSIPEPEGETLSLHSENSGEIPIQPPIVANLNDLKRPGDEQEGQDEKRQKFD